MLYFNLCGLKDKVVVEVIIIVWNPFQLLHLENIMLSQTDICINFGTSESIIQRDGNHLEQKQIMILNSKLIMKQMVILCCLDSNGCIYSIKKAFLQCPTIDDETHA